MLLARRRQLVDGEIAAEQRQRLPEHAAVAVEQRAKQARVRDRELLVDRLGRQREVVVRR